jgi:uncharacterized protein (UPF0332 family)
MTDEQAALLAEAADSLAAARAYYAMFYIAEAFLECDGLSFSKHSAVIAAFGQRYTKTGVVPAEYHHYLIEAQSLRHAGDYGERDAVNEAQAAEQIARGARFLSFARTRFSGMLAQQDADTA